MSRTPTSYIVRQVDLVKLRKYGLSTVCAICGVAIKVGDEIRRQRHHTSHFKCYERTLM